MGTGAEIEVAIPPSLPPRPATAPDRKPQPPRFTSHGLVSRQAAATWKATYSNVRQIARDLGRRRPSPRRRSEARLLTAVALSTFPNNAVTAADIDQ